MTLTDSDFRADPASPGPARDDRPEAGRGGQPAGLRVTTSGPRSWPARATCDRLIADPRIPLVWVACVLSPGHPPGCLPPPGMP